ncbi:Adherens junction-associated protein 1 [Dissostichus eleginoides]|uniref:Adherens junction-associated protein 1 n=1 Tax=Dissostichus eleginoides TaxID=100907 RepID=A0AAD9FF12_DISEL|nr:Adherens junction-associated protein 1 [Dissostichus eleginoides]
MDVFPGQRQGALTVHMESFVSPSALRPGSCVWHRVWILLAMTHLTLDFSVCSPLNQGTGVKLTPKSVPRSRPRWQPLWDTPNKLHWRTVSPLARRLLNPIPPPQENRAGIGPKVKSQKHRKPAHKGQAGCKECRLRNSQMESGDPLAVIAEAPAALSSGSRGDAVRLLLRARRQLKWDNDKSQEGRTTTVAGFIDWGPTGTDSIDDVGKPNVTLSTKVSTSTVATTTSSTTSLTQRTFTVVTTPEAKRISTTKATGSFVETVKPSKPNGDTSGVLSLCQLNHDNLLSLSLFFNKCFRLLGTSVEISLDCHLDTDVNWQFLSINAPPLTEVFPKPVPFWCSGRREEGGDLGRCEEVFGLAVHQIITITVSLIMVIAALITTLVLKNCCAQSGNGRHNSHQRKIHQQEESCQNLTDFTPARVPSKVDIFTAYNDSLQCSHECVRTAVPIYTDEMIQQTPVYKTAYNGNRPSPTERQLIPVAFVSEKWFEISC